MCSDSKNIPVWVYRNGSKTLLKDQSRMRDDDVIIGYPTEGALTLFDSSEGTKKDK
jgi:hypothetical protein